MMRPPLRIAPNCLPHLPKARALAPRRFAQALTAGAVLVSLVLSSALPARAAVEGKDLAKILVGALVVGAIIHETQKDKTAPDPVAVDHRPDRPWDHSHGRKGPKKALPQVCAIEIDGSPSPRAKAHDAPRSVAFYPERCLTDMGVRRSELPRHCSTGARIFGQKDRVYAEECLAAAGYRR